MSNDTKKEQNKKVTWLIDDNIEENKLIIIEENDPRGFLHTDKSPEEVKQILERYNKTVKIEDKLIMMSTKENEVQNKKK